MKCRPAVDEPIFLSLRLNCAVVERPGVGQLLCWTSGLDCVFAPAQKINIDIYIYVYTFMSLDVKVDDVLGINIMPYLLLAAYLLTKISS